MPKVTVAIPTYNRREYLKECIDSILAQTFQDFDIVVFDNCSDYDVHAFLDGFDDERIILIKSDKNIGPYENFNRIYRYIYDSPYVIIFHDDDVMHPELIEREVVAMDAHKEFVWVGTNLRFIKNDSEMHNFEDVKNDGVFIYDTPGIVRLILRGFNLCYDSVMYRVSQLEDMKSLVDQYSKWGDRPYLVELSKKGKVGVLKERLVNYRIHPGQDSQAVVSDKNVFLMNLFAFYRECLNDLADKNDRKLFYIHTADNLPLAGFSFAHTFREYIDNMKTYWHNNLLRLQYVTPRGLYRFMRGLLGFVRRK